MRIEHTFKGKDDNITKPLTPVKAIREKCLDCCCWQKNAVAECPVHDCALYPFRFGKNPSRKGVGGKGNAAALIKARFSKISLTQKQFSAPIPADPIEVIGQGRLRKKRCV